jgi:hypothetical protein
VLPPGSKSGTTDIKERNKEIKRKKERVGVDKRQFHRVTTIVISAPPLQ